MTEFVKYMSLPVIPLGHTGTKTFYYFVRSTRQVVALSATQHSQQYFIAMAEVPDWALQYVAGTERVID